MFIVQTACGRRIATSEMTKLEDGFLKLKDPLEFREGFDEERGGLQVAFTPVLLAEFDTSMSVRPTAIIEVDDRKRLSQEYYRTVRQLHSQMSNITPVPASALSQLPPIK